MNQMQGIVSILRSDNPEKTIKASSLRRTLSADMSSKKWLADNGSPLMKKIASSEQIAIDSSESDEEECEMSGKGDEQHPRRIDIWTAIMSQKKQDNFGTPPYVHPLVKKSASSLSEKSLKVCTESLGSETGSDVSLGLETRSDVFLSHPSSETTGEEQQQHEEREKEEHKVVKLACLTTKKAQQARSFPPPLASLAAAHIEGPSLHMHSRRIDGRLVLEAVSVPQQKYFETQRQDGRFLLKLINNPELDQPTDNEFCDVFNLSEEEKSYNNNNDNNIKDNDENDEQDYEDEDEDEDEEYQDEIQKEFGNLKHKPANGIMINNVHRSTVVAERDNENPWWSRKLNTKVSNHLSKLDVVDEKEYKEGITKSLPPPRPRQRTIGLPPLAPPSAANSVNSYQYFWRAKPSVASVIDPTIAQHRPPTKTKHLLLLRGNKPDCSFIPSLKGCKDPRRSLAMWEPFCIATS